CKCLRETHDVKSVREALNLVNDILEYQEHIAEQGCQCVRCHAWQRRGCPHPHACAVEAKTKLLDKLPSKWDPRVPNRGSRKLTDAETEANESATQEGGRLIFDPELQEEDTVSEGMRIFDKAMNQQMPPLQDGHMDQPERTYTVVYIAESEIQALEINPSARSEIRHRGAGWWRLGDTTDQRHHRVKPALAPRNAALLTAALDTVRAVGDDTNLEIVVLSKTIVEAVTRRLRQNEDKGWRDVPNKNLMMTLVARMRSRPARTAWRVGNKNEAGMVEARTLAEEAVRMPQPTTRSVLVNRREVRGMPLHKITQKSAYQQVRPIPKEAIRPQTRPQIKRIKRAQRRRGQREPTSKEIWKAISATEFRKNVAEFMYKTAHNANKCGKFWSHLDGYQERTYCVECSTATNKVVETIDHIMLRCKAPARKRLWKAAEDICEERGIKWEHLSMGVILSSGLRRIERGDKPCKGDMRLYRILMSECTYMVWLARNERVIKFEGRREDCPGGEVAVKRLKSILRRRKQIEI
ncbi:hypothetical protein BD626DRAFT_410842, partial [Schizophyllum amplum]